jgi:ATP-dependent DNA helicase Rep
MSVLSSLNSRQKEAVKRIDGPLLVLAGAGSGKTSVITRKIAYLVESCGYSARHIAAVTFTNKAAREMKERVGQLLKSEQTRGLIVSTFHNLGLNIIRKELNCSGYKSGFSIFDGTDSRALLKEILHKNDLDDDQLDIIQQQISQFKNDLKTPSEVLSYADSDGEQRIAIVYEHYQKYLKAYNAVDFDDLILVPTLMFRQHPEVLERWRNRIRYLLVDEYQDTNGCQYELVKLLVGRFSRFTVVGDDDQSIYAWRGAKPENLMQLNQDYPNLQVVKLEQNYRSTGLILKAANQVIANNEHLYDKALWSDMGFGDAIRVIKCKNEEVEAERIATEIIDQKLKHTANFMDFAVLFRGNHQARMIEMKLQQYQIPYKLSGSTSFFARNEIKDIMSYLKLIINPDDDTAFLRIINVPRRQIGAQTLEKLAGYAQERGVNLLAACAEMGLDALLPAQALDKLRRFHHWIGQLAYRCNEEDPIETLKEMINDLDYEAWLNQNASTPSQAERRMKNVWYLVDSIEKMLNKAEEKGDEMSFDDAIARLILRDILERQAEEEDIDQVQLMTLHASKGLEFPHVYIMGLEEDILPHRNSIEADAIEEERRLMYVGITRAKRYLTLTLATKRRQYGEDQETTPSRFLDEMPQENLVYEGFSQSTDAQKKERASTAIAGLKHLLNTDLS